MTPKFGVLLAAFSGFCLCMMGWIAYGFHQMDAGWMDVITVVGMLAPLEGIRLAFSEAPPVATDEEIDEEFTYA